MSNLLTTKDAAELLGLQPGTLRSWRANKNSAQYIPYVKMGYSVRYKLADIEEFILKSSKSVIFTQEESKND